MSDDQAKRALWISIFLGIFLGLLWGVPRYGFLHLSTWNLVGLGVITTVSIAALWLLLAARARARRAR